MNWEKAAVGDDELSELVRSVLDDEIVTNVIGMAMTGWDLRDPDASLAALTFDTQKEGRVAESVRQSATAERALVFESQGYVIDIDEAADQWQGQIEPVPPLLEVERLTSKHVVPVDSNGNFQVMKDVAGPLRLRVTADDASAITTEWFLSE